MELIAFKDKAKVLTLAFKAFHNPVPGFSDLIFYPSFPCLLSPSHTCLLAIFWTWICYSCSFLRAFSLAIPFDWNALHPDRHIYHFILFSSLFKYHLLRDTTPDHFTLKASSHSLTILCWFIFLYIYHQLKNYFFVYYLSHLTWI